MRISFDLDDTLICYQTGAVHEPCPIPRLFRRWAGEPLRLGATALLGELTAGGHDLWVYTTSYRSPWGVRRWLRRYGVRVTHVVNQSAHEKQFGRAGPSKNPARFGIDLHVDDSWGVWVEGRQLRYHVLVVLPTDQAWADRVRDAVSGVMRGEPPPCPPDLPDEYEQLGV